MRLIDADALKEWLDEYLSVFKKYDKGTIKGFVDHAPTIEPKRGEWKHGDMGVGYYEYPCCSKCGYETEEETNFCPNCGCAMTKESE